MMIELIINISPKVSNLSRLSLHVIDPQHFSESVDSKDLLFGLKTEMPAWLWSQLSLKFKLSNILGWGHSNHRSF